MKRRDFCLRTCQAASLLAIGSLIDGCGGGPSSPGSGAPLNTINTSLLNGTVTLTIDASSPLAAVGGAALVQASGRSFLVAHTAQDTFTAMTAVCTHEGCTVTEFDGSLFICPCHGSEFSTSGAVVQGPAPSALTRFGTQFANSVLTFSA
jgi:cytochrome b6-f complex iron-sulfur subunit